MPLTFTGPQRTLLAAAAHRLWTKVEVEDPGGGFVDLTSWFISATWSDSIDNPAMDGSVTFARDDVGTSLAPLMTGSPMNQYAAAYAAALEGERLIKISQVITTPTGVPAPGDYLEAFRGYIDSPRFGGRDQNEVSCTMRDIGGLLMDQWTEADALYPAATMEATLQAILTANPNWKLGTVTLNVPVSPAVNLSAFTLPIKPVMLALRDIADQIGWTVKYQRDASNNFLLTLFQPQRTKTVADYSLGPDEYDDVPEFEIPTNDVRNEIEIGFLDSATGLTATYRTTDAASIAKYGKRFMRIQEEPTSNIDTISEATKMGNAALSDLRLPYATQQVSVPALFWIVQCGDLIAFPSNGVLYDTTQNMGVTGYTHTISDGEGTTTIDAREQVAGGVTTWIVKEGDPGIEATPAMRIAVTQSNVLTGPPFVATRSATVSVTVTTSTDELITLYWRDPAAPTDVFFLSNGGGTPLYVASGTTVGSPSRWRNLALGIAFKFANQPVTYDYPNMFEIKAVGQRSKLETAWTPVTLDAGNTATLTTAFGNGASVIAAGDGDWVFVDFKSEIISGRLAGNPSGSLVVELWAASFAAFPTFTKISGSSPLTLSGTTAYETVMPGWTTSLPAGTYFMFKVTGTPTTVTKASASLRLRRVP